MCSRQLWQRVKSFETFSLGCTSREELDDHCLFFIDSYKSDNMVGNSRFEEIHYHLSLVPRPHRRKVHAFSPPTRPGNEVTLPPPPLPPHSSSPPPPLRYSG